MKEPGSIRTNFPTLLLLRTSFFQSFATHRFSLFTALWQRFSFLRVQRARHFSSLVPQRYLAWSRYRFFQRQRPAVSVQRSWQICKGRSAFSWHRSIPFTCLLQCSGIQDAGGRASALGAIRNSAEKRKRVSEREILLVIRFFNQMRKVLIITEALETKETPIPT